MESSNKLRLARQVLASHRAKLATATDKDSVRRSIAAAVKRVAELEATDNDADN